MADGEDLDEEGTVVFSSADGEIRIVGLRMKLGKGLGAGEVENASGVPARGVRLERVIGRGITKRYAANMALRGVDVVLRGGELTLISGGNGSGKSTLLGILGTMIRATSGSVQYESMGPGRANVRASIGWVSHDALIYPDLTGQQNVELAAALQGIEREGLWAETRERFELGRFAEDQPVRSCSRGQRQRVALARALIQKPTLLLLDEPTTGLDRAGVELLRAILVKEVGRGAIVAVVSHDEGADRFDWKGRIQLDRGRVVSRETTCFIG